MGWLRRLALVACLTPLPAQGQSCDRLQDPVSRADCLIDELRRLSDLPPTSALSWQVFRRRNPVDDAETVSVVIAPDEIQGLRSTAARLMVRCRENRTDLIMIAGRFLGSGHATVRVRINSEAPFVETWSPSADREALFAPSPIQLARRIVSAERLVLEVTTERGRSTVYVFKSAGLEPHLREISTACRWSPPVRTSTR